MALGASMCALSLAGNGPSSAPDDVLAKTRKSISVSTANLRVPFMATSPGEMKSIY
jgi:hypothetical protein